MNAVLTDKQERALCYLRTHIASVGMAPTRSEMAKALGYNSPNAAEEILKRLEAKGLIRIIRKSARGIMVIDMEEVVPEYEKEFEQLFGRLLAIGRTYRADDGSRAISEEDLDKARNNFLLVKGELKRLRGKGAQQKAA